MPGSHEICPICLWDTPRPPGVMTSRIEQLVQQLDGEGNGNFRPEHPDLVRKGLLGSTLGVRGAQRTNQLQRVAMTESRLKIPVLFGFDVIHGYRTIFPIPLAEASSFDPSLAERSAATPRADHEDRTAASAKRDGPPRPTMPCHAVPRPPRHRHRGRFG